MDGSSEDSFVVSSEKDSTASTVDEIVNVSTSDNEDADPVVEIPPWFTRSQSQGNNLGQQDGETTMRPSSFTTQLHETSNTKSDIIVGVSDKSSCFTFQEDASKPRSQEETSKLFEGPSRFSTQSRGGSEQKEEITKILATGRRPFDVALKGGPPWGFALNGGAGSTIPLYISKIVKGGKACESALVEGDYLMCVNEQPCSSVGEALDIVDTADNVLTLTVLRGLRSDLPTSSPLVSQSQSYLSRAFDLKKKERGLLTQFNDDSLIYSESRSSQLQDSVGMRPHKKRGESFNARRQSESNLGRKDPNRHSHHKNNNSSTNNDQRPPGANPKTPTLDPSVWPKPIDSRKSLPSDSRSYHERNTSAGVSKPSSSSSSSSSLALQMNRRRSDGHGLTSSSYHAHQQHQQQQKPLHQQQQYQQQQQQVPHHHHQHHHQHQQQQQQQQSNLLSMKSSPNLTKADGEGHGRAQQGHSGDHSSMSVGLGSKPSSSAQQSDPAAKQQQHLGSSWAGGRAGNSGGLSSSKAGVGVVGSSLDSGSASSSSAGGNVNNQGALSYTSNLYGALDNNNMELNKKNNTRRSMPFYNLQRYMPDYENMNHLSTAPLRSEKISEIDDIDEVTGRDSLPTSPSPKALSPHPHPQHLHHSDGPPTRDPNNLKYIKVNQNHEKYPSWPVTKPSGASDQSQPINSRAVSMTDHTNTSKEFPQKQVLAYTPGLNSLAEKNSPTSERKGEDGKLRNTSDPGFKSEFVYDRFGRVQRRNYENVEQKFEDFYNNSKPGYPPPNMDPDGHNIGDKDYNAPSPPEREAKAISEKDLSKRLDKLPVERSGESYQGSKADPKARPSQLSLKPSHSATRVDSGTSPLENSSLAEAPSLAKSMQSPRQAESLASSGREQQQQQQERYYPHSQNAISPGFQGERFGYSGSGGAIHSGRPGSHKEPLHVDRSTGSGNEQHSLIDRSRPASYTSPTGSSGGGSGGASSDGKKAFIVKQTPYYNTSTQTEMMPYAVKLSSPLSNQPGNKWRNVETQVGTFGTQTSPQSPGVPKGKSYEEKSIQARMSRDFQGSELDSSLEKTSADLNRNSTGSDFFKYPPSSSTRTSQPSQFLSREGIQAKYATDENPTDSSTALTLSGMPHFNENSAPILRKLSEEFYGGRLNQMQQDKRSMSSTSSQEMSPRHDTSSLSSVFHQPGMREAESYSSVVIHHDVSNNLFGRDDYAGSISSMGDSRNDISFSDTSSNYKASDFGAPRARNSLDPSLGTQKGRFLMQQKESGRSPNYKHVRESSAPVSSGAYTNWLPRTSGVSQLSSSADYLATDSAISSGSDVSSLASQSRSSSSDPRFLGSVSSSVQSSTSPIADKSMGSDVSSSMQIRPSASSDQSSHKRLSSDSVFESADDKETGEDPEDYQFVRKPSLRKAYGIYDETERLISQCKNLGKTPEHATLGMDPSATYAVVSRGMKYSESQGLGQIKEEGDPTMNEDDTKMPQSGPKGNHGRREEPPQKYAWQNEAWRRGRPEFEVPRTSNLKRTTSEQIAPLKSGVGGPPVPSSYDAEMANLSTQHHHHPLQAAPQMTTTTNAPPHLPRTQSESTSIGGNNASDAELKKVQQQAVLSFYQRKATGGAPPSPSSTTTSGAIVPSSGSGTTGKDSLSSPDSSLYESIVGGGGGQQQQSSRTTTESVSDIISKANENLAKSAQRVDSIRRSNSASSRHSADYMEMARHERMRKETEWSRLRSSGSIRYSPDHQHHSGVRSNRSSFASENHYEDISMFAPSTPTEESKEMRNNNGGQVETDASMDSGVMASHSPTYLNLPAKRRPPPPPPSRSPSPDSPPPALPPRNYKENAHHHNNHHHNNNNYNKTAPPPPSQQTSVGSLPPRGHAPPATAAVSSPQRTLSEAVQRARTMPLAKTQPLASSNAPVTSTEDEPAVDNSKRDFKSLMSQWENSSPREERYAAELRRQAQQLRLNTQPQPKQQQQQLQQQQQPVSNNSQPQQQQQQHPHHNAMPMALKHSRPAIGMATTYKREPTLPQEATSPLNSPTASSSSTKSSSSSSHFTTSSPHHQHQHQHQQSPLAASSNSITPPPSSSSTSSTSLPMPNSSPATSSSSPAFTSNKHQQQQQQATAGAVVQPYHQSLSNNPAAFISSSSSVATLPPQIPQRVGGVLEESRMRSSSDLSAAPSPGRGSGNTNNRSSGSHAQPLLRERSSSEHDILGDRKGVSPSHSAMPHYHASASPNSPSNASMSSSSSASSSAASVSPKDSSTATTKWRPKRGPMPPPPPAHHTLAAEDRTEVAADSDFPPPPPPEALQISEHPEVGFAEDSYIGHKNKSSRAIGTYKRSKSAAVLQTDNNNYKIAGEASNSAFPDKTLGQQSWNSESVLQSRDAFSAGGGSGPSSSYTSASGDRIDSIPEHNNVVDGNNTPPARPPSRVPNNNNNAPAPPSSHATHQFSSPSSAHDSSSSSSSMPASISLSPPSSTSASSVSSSFASPSSLNDLPSSSSSSSSSSSTATTKTSAAGTPVFTARPFVIEQPGGGGGWGPQRDSPRRQPPPVPNSPPFDPNAPQFPGQAPSPPVPSHQSPPSSSSSPYDQHQRQQQSRPSPSSANANNFHSSNNKDGSPSQYSQHSPNRHHMDNNSARSPNANTTSALSSQTKSANINNANVQSHHQFNNKNSNAYKDDDATPITPPPRDYGHHRRDSAPGRPATLRSLPGDASASASANAAADGSSPSPPSFSALANRRQSESSVTSARSESEHAGGGDLSGLTSSGHTRQPSQEELECDLKAKQLANHLENSEDQKLSEVLRQDASKKRMHYMDGLFSTENLTTAGVDVGGVTDNAVASGGGGQDRDRGRDRAKRNPNVNGNASDSAVMLGSSGDSPKSNDSSGRRPNLPREYWVSAPKALVEMQVRTNQEMVKDLTRDVTDKDSLVKQKEELLEKLSKKLDVLEEDKISVQKEIQQNDAIGVQMFDLIQSKSSGKSVMDKVTTFNEDQEKIVRLMLNLSGQLARAENAVQALGQDADTKAKKLATDKLTRQRSKYEEAKSIKDDMDKRKEQVISLVQEHLGDNESKLFALFISKKPQLTIELQDLEDKIKLGREQMDELKKSIPEHKSTS